MLAGSSDPLKIIVASLIASAPVAAASAGQQLSISPPQSRAAGPSGALFASSHSCLHRRGQMGGPGTFLPGSNKSLSPNLERQEATQIIGKEDPFRHSPSHLVEARAHRGAPGPCVAGRGLDSRGLELSGAVLLSDNFRVCQVERSYPSSGSFENQTEL